MSSAKPSYDDDHLDFGKLEKEAKSLMEYDELYWQQNSAKFRAVEQKVATYDEFREMVNAAHLKPLEKEDKISSMGTFTQVWNQSAPRSKSDQKQALDAKKDFGAAPSDHQVKLPTSGQEFLQHWRRECKTLDQQRNFLITLGASRLGGIFKTEISGGLLGDFIACLNNSFDFSTEAAAVIDIMEAFSASQRFSISLAFLSKKEKEHLSELFEKLSQGCGSGDAQGLRDKADMLRNVYSV